MNDLIDEKRKDQAGSNLNLSNAFLASIHTSTLASPERGFGKQTPVAFNESSPAHKLNHIPLHSQDRVNNQLGESPQSAVTNVVQRKATSEPQQEIVQARSVIDSGGQKKPIMRDGSDIPGGAIVEAVDGVDSLAIMGQLRSLAMQSEPALAKRADFDGRVKPMLSAAIANNLAPRSFSFNFIEESGVNAQWTGSISFRMGTPQEDTGGGDASVQRNFGGSGTVTNQTTNATTDSASATGGFGFKSGEAAKGGEATSSGGVTAGTSTTRTDQTTNSATTNGGGSATMTNQLKRYRAPVIVDISVEGSADFSGSDYVNPFKWGFSGAQSLFGNGRKSGQFQSGSVGYYISRGLSASTASGAVQRKGWIEQQLGITEQSKVNFGTAIAAYSTNPVQLSNSGSAKLPQHIASAAEQHHGIGLDRVRLIHGGQANDYCNSMSASAFTTPGNEGGTNIFMHSQIPINSPQGQHTLLHEVAHAVQQVNGETTGLDGLGGDHSRRDLLEKNADSHADAILSNNSALPKLK